MWPQKITTSRAVLTYQIAKKRENNQNKLGKVISNWHSNKEEYYEAKKFQKYFRVQFFTFPSSLLLGVQQIQSPFSTWLFLERLLHLPIRWNVSLDLDDSLQLYEKFCRGNLRLRY